MEVKDTSKILQIAATVIALFSFNNIKGNQIKAYVKENMYEWIEKRKSEAEIETMIKNEARRIDN